MRLGKESCVVGLGCVQLYLLPPCNFVVDFTVPLWSVVLVPAYSLVMEYEVKE